jgi:cyclopropane fatty-acyl-phospholipid synthase-like methyltransferase
MISSGATPAAPSAEEVRDFYDADDGNMLEVTLGANLHPGFWAGPADGSDFGQAQERLTDQVIARLPVSAGQRVLDIGSGLGRPAIRLARATGAQVTGISTSAGQVAAASRQARREGLAGQVRFEQADALELPFAAESFDAAMAIDSFIHLPRGTAYAQVHRVLRPGGVVVAEDHYAAGPGTARTAALVDALRRLLVLGPVLELGEYLDQVHAARLDLLQITDITPNVAPTWAAVMRRVQDSSAEVTARYGEGAVGAYQDLTAGLARHSVPRYMIISVRRPDPAADRWGADRWAAVSRG